MLVQGRLVLGLFSSLLPFVSRRADSYWDEDDVRTDRALWHIQLRWKWSARIFLHAAVVLSGHM
jgi:hypothetical protein